MNDAYSPYFDFGEDDKEETPDMFPKVKERKKGSSIYCYLCGRPNNPATSKTLRVGVEWDVEVHPHCYQYYIK